jgi:uncharacterized membrane protein YhaH (DUF805 family)
MFCRKCGEKNDDNSLFCKQCGTSIKTSINESQNVHRKTVQAISPSHKSTVVSPTESHKHTKHDNRNLLENFIDAFKKYAVFKGRSSRREYWMFYLAVIMIQMASLLIVFIGRTQNLNAAGIADDLGQYIQNAPFLLSFDPMSAVAVISVPIAILVPVIAVIVSRFRHISKRMRTTIYSILATIYVVLLFMMTYGHWYVFDPIELYGSLALPSLLILAVILLTKKPFVRIGVFTALLIVYLLGLTYIMIVVDVLLLISGALLILASIIPSVAIAVRRLHDTDRSAWWLFINLIPIVGPIVYIVILAMDGNHDENNYGLNPQGE